MAIAICHFGKVFNLAIHLEFGRSLVRSQNIVYNLWSHMPVFVHFGSQERIQNDRPLSRYNILDIQFLKYFLPLESKV